MKKLSFLTLLLTVFMQLAFAHASFIQQPLPASLKFAPPAISFTINEFAPLSLTVPIPCAGEEVELEGILHNLLHVTISGNRLVVRSLVNPQGISGTGSVSGEKYQATGGTQETSTGSLVNGQFSGTLVNNFRIIGQSTGNNFLVHETLHFTVNADGTVTTEVDNITIECK